MAVLGLGSEDAARPSMPFPINRKDVDARHKAHKAGHDV